MDASPRIVRWLLLTILLIVPWLFGGVWASVQWWVMLAVGGLLAAELLVRLSDDVRPTILPIIWLPPLFGIGLALFQLVPLTPELATYLAPARQLWTEQLTSYESTASGDFDDVGLALEAKVQGRPAVAPGPLCRSFYPAGTREQLALLVLVTGVLVLSASLCVDHDSIRPVLCAFSVCGATLAFFGVVQRLSWNGKFYWMFEPLEGSASSFGPYVNRNHAGGYLNLCVAYGLGWVLLTHPRHHGIWSSQSVGSSRGSRRRSGRSESGYGASRRSDRSTSWDRSAASGYDPSASARGGRSGWRWLARWREAIEHYLAELTLERLSALTFVAFSAGGVLCTASRGSIVALLAASALTMALLVARRGHWGHAVVWCLLLSGGLALMSWADQTEFVRQRFAGTWAESTWNAGRIPNWLAALDVYPYARFAGTGLGTYSLVYERFQERFFPAIIHTHAENQFLQALIEGGLIGLGLLLIAVACMVVAIARLTRSARTLDLACAAAGVYGLVSQCVGGFFDFGLYLPANSMALAMLCGLVVGRASRFDRSKSEPQSGQRQDEANSADVSAVADESAEAPGAEKGLRDGVPLSDDVAESSRSWLARATFWRVAPYVSTSIVGLLMLGCLFGSLEMKSCAVIEKAMRHAQLETLTRDRDSAGTHQAIRALQTSLPQRWDDAFAQQHLALLYMLQYRLEVYQQLLAEQRESASTEVAASDRAGSEQPTNAARPEVNAPNDEELWQRAAVYHVHDLTMQAMRDGNRTELQQWRTHPQVTEWLLPAARHALASRQAAPTIAKTHYLLAELAPVIPLVGDASQHLHRTRTLAPADAHLLFWTGLLDLYAGRQKEACESWQRSLDLSPAHLHDVVRAAQGRLTARQLLEDAVPLRSELLVTLAKTVFVKPAQVKLRQYVLQRAEQGFSVIDLPDGEAAYTRASVLRLLARAEDALEQYALAVAADRQQVNWRYEYATLLLEEDQFDRAKAQVQILDQLRPGTELYRRLRREITAKELRQGSPAEAADEAK